MVNFLLTNNFFTNNFIDQISFDKIFVDLTYFLTKKRFYQYFDKQIFFPQFFFCQKNSFRYIFSNKNLFCNIFNKKIFWSIFIVDKQIKYDFLAIFLFLPEIFIQQFLLSLTSEWPVVSLVKFSDKLSSKLSWALSLAQLSPSLYIF